MPLTEEGRRGVLQLGCLGIRISRALESGALAKGRMDSNGVVSLLYEQNLSPLTKITLCSQFDATDLNKAPKIGIALGLKN